MRLPDGLDWIMRPWIEGRVSFRDLQDGTYDLADIADMNDALDVRDENAARANDAMKKMV